MHPPQLPDVIEFRGNKVFVTNHAVCRFIERLSKINPGSGLLMKNPIRTIRRMLKRAEKVELDPMVRLKRLLNNSCKPAEYWLHPETKLRFVIICDEAEDCRTLVTVEQPHEFVGKLDLKPMR